MSSVHTRPSTSTKAGNVVLYRRILFPSLPPSVDPPPLLPSQSPELNAELYDFVALALRAYITPWWSKITRYDREFIPHVAVLLGVVARALAARLALAHADLPELLYRAAPALVAQHYADYRAAAAKLGTSYASGGAATLPQLFHHLQGHMAVDAEGHIDAAYVRHTLDRVLQACLPPEDYASDAEHAIVREVGVKVLLGDVVPLLTQPWFLHKLLLEQLRSDKSSGAVKVADASPVRTSGPSFHTLVVFFLSAVQYLSGLSLVLIHWYKQTKSTVRLVNAMSDSADARQKRGYAESVLRCASEVVHARDRAAATSVFDMLGAIASLCHHFLDRLAIYVLQTFVLTERSVLRLVKASKQTLFPNGYPGPPPVIPTPEEQAVIKEQLVRELQERAPPILSALILGPVPVNRQTILSALAPLSSEACNAHLVLFVLDLIVITLFPELGAKTVDSGDVEGVAIEAGSDLSRGSSMQSVESEQPSAGRLSWIGRGPGVGRKRGQ